MSRHALTLAAGMDPQPPHDEAACFALHREQLRVETIARFTIDGEPASKSRPRFSRRNGKVHTYTPEQTKAAERAVAWKFKQVARTHTPDADTTYGVMALFFNGTNQRRDVDNMIKLICDGLNGVAWADDSQVVEVSGRRGIDLPENARTEVWIYRVGMVPGLTECKGCGKRFRVPPAYQKYKANHCSIECRSAALAAARERTCQGCGKTYDSRNGAKFCSRACRSKGHTVTVQCSECSEPFSMPKSTRQQAKSPVCGDECRAKRKERRDTYCVNGHEWAIFGTRRPDGRRYCKECARIRAAERKQAK